MLTEPVAVTLPWTNGHSLLLLHRTRIPVLHCGLQAVAECNGLSLVGGNERSLWLRVLSQAVVVTHSRDPRQKWMPDRRRSVGSRLSTLRPP